MYTSLTEDYVETLIHLRIINKYTLHTQFYKQIYPHVNLRTTFTQPLGFPGGSDGTESACNAGDPGSIPGLGRFPGEGNATHSSILAWRTPWTEESLGLLCLKQLLNGYII